MKQKKKIPTQRSLDALETKDAILNTALYLFSKYGYDKITVDDITTHAGFSKGSFYTHFKSKESILVEQFHKIDDCYDAAFDGLSENVTASERLLILVQAMSHYCMEVCGVDVIRIVYANQVNSSHTIKILNNKKRRIYYYLHDIAARGKRSGEFLIDMSDKDLSELLMRFCRSLIYDWCLYGNKMNLVEEGERFFSQILTWLSFPTPPVSKNSQKNSSKS
jgi:AcrR family transcriptional regulator